MKLPEGQRPHFETFLRACEAVRTEGLERAARRSGCPVREGCFEIELLGRTFLLRTDPPSVEPGASDREKACVARYVMLARPLPDLTPVAFADVPEARTYLGPFRGRVIAPFLGFFGRSPEEFARAAEPLGGKKTPYGGEAPAPSGVEAPALSGVEAWSLRVFPLVMLSFVLWPGDDEFEPEATVLFPRGLFEVFEVEDAVVMADLASRALRRPR